MRWIGLTGGIGSGKSSVAGILRDKGLDVLDADEVAHQTIVKGGPAYEQIVNTFGSDILNSSGDIDRSVLGQKVFASRDKLKELESIVHPEVRQRVDGLRTALEKSGKEIAFYDVPLLYEKNMEDGFDAVIVVYVEEDQQIERVMKRMQISDAEARRRLGAQIPLTEKKSRADFVIDNSGSLADLKSRVEEVLKKIL